MHGTPPSHLPRPSPIPRLATPRLHLTPFAETDIPALAAILKFPEVAKGILADGATPTRARKHAARRIHWHNATWPTHGYGIWAVRLRQDGPDDRAEDRPRGRCIGWCGFTRPDLGTEPELLYGLHPHHWHQGLATEATRAALDWLFATTPHGAATAVIFTRINPPSEALVRRLGFVPHGRFPIADFMTDRDLAREVIAFETWRLGKSKHSDPARLLFDAAHKVGQIASLFPADQGTIAAALATAAAARSDLGGSDPADRARRAQRAFAEGIAEPWLDWWRKAR
jgi:RimJ/RimL family protein N-acetyltransferase